MLLLTFQLFQEQPEPQTVLLCGKLAPVIIGRLAKVVLSPQVYGAIPE